MQPDVWPSEHERRREERRHLLFATSAKGEEGGSQPVLVRDISARGLLIETEEGALLDKTIAVALPEAGEVTAQVIWHGDKLAGCRLADALSQATIDAVRATGAAMNAEQPEEDDGAGAETPVPRSAARTLAARLKELRLARDLTRAELAERSGISTPSIWAWETGRTVPRLGSLETLARGLGVSVSELQIGVDMTGERVVDSPAEGGAPGTPDPHATRLAELVAASKAQIAALAGVAPQQVTITIAL